MVGLQKPKDQSQFTDALDEQATFQKITSTSSEIVIAEIQKRDECYGGLIVIQQRMEAFIDGWFVYLSEIPSCYQCFHLLLDFRL
ncbi:MAG: hypothetical protein EZS28_025296 [Streblomastix strix]|uniref:Uncharacterized protein n=1 Tax=Streblomastix strix TaxID=222440 RepID=A0A5J4V9J7_9EUKA|nr:MAG: hypothetical protein EZS28_025296 [Streblomastix strix]